MAKEQRERLTTNDPVIAELHQISQAVAAELGRINEAREAAKQELQSIAEDENSSGITRLAARVGLQYVAWQERQLARDAQLETIDYTVEEVAQGLDEIQPKLTGFRVRGQSIKGLESLRERVLQRFLEQHPQELQIRPESVTNTGSMEFDAQRIVEQELATAQPDAAPHPAPDTQDQLAVIVDKATRLNSTLAELRDRGVPLTATEAEVTIAGLHDIAVYSNNTARQLGLHAVERGLLSQLKVARLLRVSSVTVNRWFHKGLDADEADRLPDRRSHKDKK